MAFGRLSRRPGKHPAGQYMEMKMANGLSALFPAVCHHPVSLVQMKLLCQFCDHRIDVTDNGFILLSDSKGAGNMLFWYHQKVDRSLRVDVVKGIT